MDAAATGSTGSGATGAKPNVGQWGILGTAILAISVATMSAAMVCHGNVCWHATEQYEYPPAAGVIVHEDAWKPGASITIREHEGQGYWKGDSWTT